MKNFNFAAKELVESFSYTTTTQNRMGYKDVQINGRSYTKWGTIQAVTIVGELFKDNNGNRVLLVGVSKQNPCDTRCNKQLAYEQAELKAWTDPDMVIAAPENMTIFNFNKMMSWYVDMMDLKFLKTRQELEIEGLDPKKYLR